jgi:enoyl-CoA hydratase
VIHRYQHDSIAVLRMEHGKANALDAELVGTLADELAAIERAGNASAVVLTGTGSIFSAGVDLYRFLESGEEYHDRFFAELVRCFHQLFEFPRPLIAAVNGHAIAGGAVMVSAADYRIMARGRATIGVPELRVGIPFPVVAIEILRFAASTRHLQQMVYLGRTYTAQDGLEVGLIDELVEPDALLERALEMAAEMGSTAPARFRLTKRELRAPALDRVARHSPAADPEVLAGWKAPDTHAALRAYVERTLERPK